MNDEWKQTAALVLAKCAANDPWFPNGGESVVLAWAEVFKKSNLQRIDLVEGVTLAYMENGAGFKPLPADIVKYGTAHYHKALNALTSKQREAMDETTYALIDQGYVPREAHQFARMAALGRPVAISLTDDDRKAISTRVAAIEGVGA